MVSNIACDSRTPCIDDIQENSPCFFCRRCAKRRISLNRSRAVLWEIGGILRHKYWWVSGRRKLLAEFLRGEETPRERDGEKKRERKGEKERERERVAKGEHSDLSNLAGKPIRHANFVDIRTWWLSFRDRYNFEAHIPLCDLRKARDHISTLQKKIYEDTDIVKQRYILKIRHQDQKRERVNLP